MAVWVTDLNALSALDRASLKQLWHQLWNRPAPRQASRKRLRHIAERLDTRTRQPTALVPGTRLIRQWRGQRHEVRVLERGYLYRGTRYASLSAIACLISGTHCSGPRFFGLAPGSTLPRKVTGGR